MARLPIPGSDDGNWGEILNEYLSQSLEADGSVKSGIITKHDIGLSNVDNTSDSDKPVSTLVQVALDQKTSNKTLEIVAANNFVLTVAQCSHRAIKLVSATNTVTVSIPAGVHTLISNETNYPQLITSSISGLTLRLGSGERASITT